MNNLSFELREASHIDFVHEKRRTDVLLETPHTPPPEKRHALFLIVYLAGFKIECCVKKCKSALGAKPGADHEHTYMLDFVYFVLMIS